MVGTWSPCLEVVLLAIFLLTAPSCIHPPLLSAPMHCILLAPNTSGDVYLVPQQSDWGTFYFHSVVCILQHSEAES